MEIEHLRSVAAPEGASALSVLSPSLSPERVLRSGEFPRPVLFPRSSPLPVPRHCFDDFAGSTERSDFPRLFVIGVGPSTSRHGLQFFPLQTTWDLPIPAQGACIHARPL